MHHDTALIAAYRGTAHVHELIAAWERNNAPVHIDPLPRHRYCAEVIFDNGTSFHYFFKRLNALLYFSRNAKLMAGKATSYLLISRDGNFFTAKEV